MDSVSEGRLKFVHPNLARLVRQLAEKLATEGINIRVTQGFRSYMDQQNLYAQGRTAPGKIVTAAQGGHSWHNFGLAVDLAPMNHGIAAWNDQKAWDRIVAEGEALGLRSGKAWNDVPHLEMTGKFGPSPDDEVRCVYLNGGCLGVWDEAGLKIDNQEKNV